MVFYILHSPKVRIKIKSRYNAVHAAATYIYLLIGARKKMNCHCFSRHEYKRYRFRTFQGSRGGCFFYAFYGNRPMAHRAPGSPYKKDRKAVTSPIQERFHPFQIYGDCAGISSRIELLIINIRLTLIFLQKRVNDLPAHNIAYRRARGLLYPPRSTYLFEESFLKGHGFHLTKALPGP